MREIVFRGKRKDNGKWVFGFLHKMDGYGTGYTEYGIQVQDISTSRPWSVLVITETVGQYTGLTDKNGKKIFEGDIVKATFSHNNWMQDRVEKRTATYEVRYNEKYCYFYLAKHQNNMLFDGNWTYFLHEIEVIGNVHDNPELLKGGE